MSNNFPEADLQLVFDLAGQFLVDWEADVPRELDSEFVAARRTYLAQCEARGVTPWPGVRG